MCHKVTAGAVIQASTCSDRQDMQEVVSYTLCITIFPIIPQILEKAVSKIRKQL